MTQRGYNSNLASEFYVLSMLCRLGLDANLTLGNKKSVDITVVHGPGSAVTVDVKAVVGKTDWLMGTPLNEPKPKHFVVLVSYEGQFRNPAHAPRCWIVPHGELLPRIKSGGTKGLRYLSRSGVRDQLAHRENAWALLCPAEGTEP